MRSMLFSSSFCLHGDEMANEMRQETMTYASLTTAKHSGIFSFFFFLVWNNFICPENPSASITMAAPHNNITAAPRSGNEEEDALNEVKAVILT